MDHQPLCYTNNVPAYGGIVFGVIFDFLAVFAYLPQIHKLFQRMSNEGLSLTTLLFYNISCTASMYNTINSNWQQINCCRLISWWQCTELLLAFIELGIVWLNWLIIYILCLVFFPPVSDEEELKEQRRVKSVSYILFTLFFVVFLCGGTAITILFNYWYSKNDLVYKVTDSIFGVISSVIIIVVWLPQIYTTWKAQDPGSLSVVMLLITTPGGYLTVMFVAFIYNNSFWVWLPTMFSAICQTILLALCIKFECAKSNRKRLRCCGCQEDQEASYHPIINASGTDIPDLRDRR